jgi:hypothetical protein
MLTNMAIFYHFDAYVVFQRQHISMPQGCVVRQFARHGPQLTSFIVGGCMPLVLLVDTRNTNVVGHDSCQSHAFVHYANASHKVCAQPTS